jgi:hypothetical protein
MIRHSPADWMMRHLVGEATPELEHLREGAPLCGPSVSRKYSAFGVDPVLIRYRRAGGVNHAR